jgi:hypothetical protein
VDGWATDVVERDEMARALTSIFRREKWRIPTMKEMAASILTLSSTHDDLFRVSHLDTRLSALSSAAKAHGASCMTCANLKHSLRAERNHSLAPDLQDS